ncbi:MAG: hypothetical protein RLZZ502_1419 [Pseudomonadota bacterium]|jgi:hypothetical protein
MWWLIMLAALAAFLFYVSRKPDSFKIEREVLIKASPEQVYPHINSLAAHRAWSIWERLDPNMKRELSGPEAGAGAFYGWEGNKEVGKGNMTILESTFPSNVKIRIEFFVPMRAVNEVQYVLSRDGEHTRVVHWMSGPAPFVHKLMSTVVNIDKMVGARFEDSLNNLKALIETPAAAPD